MIEQWVRIRTGLAAGKRPCPSQPRGEELHWDAWATFIIRNFRIMFFSAGALGT